MYISIMFADKVQKECLTEKDNKESYSELGKNLAEFIPVEKIEMGNNGNWAKYPTLNNWEIYFANTLYEFYSNCEQDKNKYNENEFLSILSKSGCYFIPKSRVIFNETLSFKVVEYLLNQKAEYLNKIDYMITVAYELIKRKITLNRCKECGKWFVAYNKIDTLYCNNCAKAREKEIDAIIKMEKVIRHNCSVKMNNSTRSDAEYTKYFDIHTKIIEKKKTKKATLAEMKEYHEWLKHIRKTEFPKTKGE